MVGAFTQAFKNTGDVQLMAHTDCGLTYTFKTFDTLMKSYE
ncbi:hypothetical protein Nizo2259_2206 [Lactiplantibacillus plantarum]|uniref:Uncharacterized protein n=1 Tax=Lactiplantibacillus plantarum TaxID=1590 RepID=A0A165R5N5_LACPN|nr:hypothetical protein Nizo2259_2206 [Lactiplantibacillus plantarum]KZU17117.1 hypothetical protein Nizo2484_2528 [Lactiplantibacillus plantarum]KZU28873.1 hypothetical protein Nizo2485_0210 [Lactiplantibacillus plantarum]KZU92134.1 hypothetical protein Lp19_3420 [Lactiplantibacillus plantarum]